MSAWSGLMLCLFDVQFFYFDSVESLPAEPLTPEDVKPLNSRYDAQIAVFGSKLQQKLEDAKVFLVGAGALGCEFLKNLALMGVSCGPKGKLIVTDDDVIEKSNLSRQFLFRDWNIGQAKSTVAASAANAINPSLRTEALQNRVSSDTENVFDDTFWENLDVVVNALDNVNARLYVDSRCVYFQKPLLESGTLGTKCNTQMVIPNLTENYGASRDPPEKQAPMCTVHSFPHNIDHCLTWARSEFEGSSHLATRLLCHFDICRRKRAFEEFGCCILPIVMYDVHAMHHIGWDPVVEHSLLCLGCSDSFVLSALFRY